MSGRAWVISASRAYRCFLPTRGGGKGLRVKLERKIFPHDGRNLHVLPMEALDNSEHSWKGIKLIALCYYFPGGKKGVMMEFSVKICNNYFDADHFYFSSLSNDFVHVFGIFRSSFFLLFLSRISTSNGQNVARTRKSFSALQMLP